MPMIATAMRSGQKWQATSMAGIACADQACKNVVRAMAPRKLWSRRCRYPEQELEGEGQVGAWGNGWSVWRQRISMWWLQLRSNSAEVRLRNIRMPVERARARKEERTATAYQYENVFKTALDSKVWSSGGQSYSFAHRCLKRRIVAQCPWDARETIGRGGGEAASVLLPLKRADVKRRHVNGVHCADGVAREPPSLQLGPGPTRPPVPPQGRCVGHMY